MKKHNNIVMVLVMVSVLVLSACSEKAANSDNKQNQNQAIGAIYLYGEQHGVEKISAKELELWKDYYENKGMRHLFIEVPYYTAEWLNLWVQSENDEILDQIYSEWKGSANYKICVKEFYKEIKDKYPETIFHGTDVGHQYKTTGKRFLEYLELNALKDSDQYKLTLEVIEQGKYYMQEKDKVYRENKMVENFIRAFNKLNNESVMGIYGNMHVRFNSKNITNEVENMGTQIKDVYEDKVYSKNLYSSIDETDAERVDNFLINEHNYEGSYYGEGAVTNDGKEIQCKFWRLEVAYDDFKDMKLSTEYIAYEDYPMEIEKHQVYMIISVDGADTFGSKFYRSDGKIIEGKLVTEEFILE